MQAPINITQDPKLGPVVSGRKLYSIIAKEACQAKRDMFSDWFREREKKFALTEGVDFYTLRSAYPNPEGGPRKVIEFVVTLQVAKKLAKFQMLSRGMPFLKALGEYERSQLLSDSSSSSGTDNGLTTIVSPVRELISPIADVNNKVANLPAKPQPTALQQLLQHVQAAADKESELLDCKARIDQQGDRLAMLEHKMDALTGLFRQAALVLFGELPVGASVASAEPDITTESEDDTADVAMFAQEPISEALQPDTVRAKLVRVVNDYSEVRSSDYREVWRWLYAQLNNTYRFNVKSHKVPSDKTYLDVVERSGYISQLYTIAKATLTPKVTVAQG